MEPSNQEPTSFTIDKGLYGYKVMPFGLKNAGATYKRLVDAMFTDNIGKIMEVYVDDMLVKNVTIEDQIKNLGIVFDILLQYGMRLNLDNCVFSVLGGKFLGFVVSKRGIEANPEKVQAILDMAPPKTRNEVQSLTGKVVAPAQFISRLTDKCAPFFKLLKTHHGPEHDKAFQGLRDYLASVPTLSKPIPGEVLYIYLTVSVTAISAALVRREDNNELPIYYTDKGFNDAESRYSDIEKFTLALLIAARRLRQYFQAHTIHVLTNQTLKQVLQKSESLGRLVKWSIELGEFDIHYTPRTAIKGQAATDFIAEFIRREDAASLDETVSENHTTPTWTLHVDRSSNSKQSGAGVVLTDPEGNTYEYALQFKFKASNNAAECEALIVGIQLAKELGVMKLAIFSDSQLVVNQVDDHFQAKESHLSHYQSRAKALLQRCLANHIIALIPWAQNSKADAVARLATSPPNTDMGDFKPSIDKPFSEIFLTESERTPSWMDPFIDYLSKGIEPQDKTIATRLRRRATLYTVREVKLYKKGRSFPLLKCISLEEGQRVLLSLHSRVCGNHTVDYNTKWVEDEALATIIVAKVINFLWKNIYCRFRIPEITIIDTQFDNYTLRELVGQYGTQIRYASPEHPQTNGQVEAVNKIIKQNLKRRLDDAKGLWVEKLPKVLWVIKTTPTKANGDSPFCLSFRFEAVIPVEQEVHSERVACFDPLTNLEGLNLDSDLLEEHHERAHL
ncbi:uncharacterized protein LOC112170643 [Rosa chinensis]|uniref:uncharacterized protein LOC112170643 n=1 Tax=Rosa chinensis TaxID=74649 RepID=UPI000D0930FA|nr:uncharacterized protein LOC112170643 [Rosa chinensis]